MRRDATGIATLTIDIAFVAKLQLCVEMDRVSGFRDPHPYSLTAFLKVCYVMRRPYFVMTDAVVAALFFGESRNE